MVYNLFFILGNGHSCSLEGLQGKNLMLGDRHGGPGNDRSCVSRFLVMNSASHSRQLKRLIKMCFNTWVACSERVREKPRVMSLFYRPLTIEILLGQVCDNPFE